MKGRTKTILAIVLAIAIVAVAAVGTVTFLKDNGEASAAETEGNKTLPVAGSDEGTDSGESLELPENLNGGENTENSGTVQNGETTTPGTADSSTSNVSGRTETTAGTVATEPEVSTIEQERLVSQTLNWSNIELNGNVGERNVNYTNLKYTVNYYKVGEEEELLYSETNKAEYGTTVAVSEEDINSHCPVGYKLDEETETSVVIGANEEENVINVYYIKDESQTKDITYTVKHYIEDKYQENDDFEETVSVWVNDETAPVSYEIDENKYVGYKLSENDVAKTAKDGDVFTVKYVKDDTQKKDITYTVKHYIEEEYQENDDFEETVNVWVNDETVPVSYELDENKYVGYKLSENDLTETAKDGDVFTVKYVKDDTQTKELTYKVEYYKDNNLVEADTQVVTKSVWVNAESLSVDVENINVTDKYIGYSFEKTEPATIPTEIEGNGVIKVYYTINSYTLKINYVYEDGTKAEETYIKEVNYNDEYSVISPTIAGYTADIETVEGVMPANNVEVTVTYKINSYKLTINYVYSDGTEAANAHKENLNFNETYSVESPEIAGYTADIKIVAGTMPAGDVTVTVTYDINSYILTINYVYSDGTEAAPTYTDTLDYKEEYSVESPAITGYTANPETVEGTMPAGNVTVTVTYTINTYNYKVEYYYATVLDNTKTDIKSAKYNAEITTYEDKVIDGYVFEKVEGLPLTISENEDQNVIKVYYVKGNFQYTVEYYYDNTIDNEKTVTETALFGTEINEYTDKNITGYKFQKTENLPLTVSSNPENNVIKVYYERETYEYTVKYFYNGVLDESKTETKSAKYNDVIREYDDKNIEGYTFEKTENLPLTVTEVAKNNVIEVYYGTPDISVTSVAVTEAHVGEEITYTITLENTGRVAGTIPVTNTLPEDVTFISATGDAQPVDGVITWDEITVVPGVPVVLTIVVKVNDNAIGKTLTDTVEVPDKEPTVHTTHVAELSSTLQEVKQGETGKDSVNVVLVMDLSSSMNEKVKTFTECTHQHSTYTGWDWQQHEYCPQGCELQANGKWGKYSETNQTRLQAAKAAAQGFVNGIYTDSNSQATVTVITFNNKYDGNSKYVGTKVLTFGANNNKTATKDNYGSLVTEIGNINIGTATSGYGTHIKAALDKTYDTIYGTNGLTTTYPDNENVVIFLGDGDPYHPSDRWDEHYDEFKDNTETNINNQATAIKNAGATIYSIGFGEDATNSSSEAYRVLKNMSSNNTIYTANDYSALAEIFTNIQAELQDRIAGTNVGNLVFTASNTLVVDANNPLQVKVGDTVIFTCTDITKLGDYNVTYNASTREISWDLNAWNSDPNHTHVTTNNAVLTYYVAR